MAATQIGKKLSQAIRRDISVLLGRGKVAFTCPLTAAEQVELWEGMIDPPIVAAFKLLCRENIKGIQYSSISAVNFRTEIDELEYHIKLSADQRTFLNMPHSPNASEYLRSAYQVECAVPNAKYQDFLSWVKNCAIVQRDFSHALNTLDAVLKFSGTIGQLVRAVPDLHRYLDRDRQIILGAQTRPSNMPYEWASFDRSRVHNLQVSMAKAHLMPAQPNTWDEIDETGAVFA